MKSCIAFVLSLSLAVPLFGLADGDRVRVTLEGDQTIGTVTSLNQSGFVLELSDGRSLPVAYSDIGKLEQSLGTKNYAKRYGKRGLLIGAIPGSLLGLALVHVCILCEADPTVSEQLGAMLGGGIMLGLPSGLVGLMIGAARDGEEWATLPIGGRLRVSPMVQVASVPGGRYAVLGARIRF